MVAFTVAFQPLKNQFIMVCDASIEPYGSKEQHAAKKSFFQKWPYPYFLFAHAYLIGRKPAQKGKVLYIHMTSAACRALGISHGNSCTVIFV